ncbi:hypothetical protein ACOMHN_016448 [Nucella lapillus]
MLCTDWLQRLAARGPDRAGLEVSTVWGSCLLTWAGRTGGHHSVGLLPADLGWQGLQHGRGTSAWQLCTAITDSEHPIPTHSLWVLSKQGPPSSKLSLLPHPDSCSPLPKHHQHFHIQTPAVHCLNTINTSTSRLLQSTAKTPSTLPHPDSCSPLPKHHDHSDVNLTVISVFESIASQWFQGEIGDQFSFFVSGTGSSEAYGVRQTADDQQTAAMDLPEEEAGPGLPEGGVLPLMADMLFAGAILAMIYPSLRRTINHIDRHFCRQLWHISEVLLALASLSFVIMLMVAQQTRVTYCSFIRPFVGDQPDADFYAGILLKLVVCALVVVNYFFASALQRVCSVWFRGSRNEGTGVPAGWSGAGHRGPCRHARSSPETPRETLSNVNTNSQTPVPPTEEYSDIFSTVSSLGLNSDSCEDQSHMVHNPRLLCDVGTMVRFPEYQRSLCTLQLSQSHVTQVRQSSRSQSRAKSSFPTPPCPSPSSPLLQSPTASSTGFCTLLRTSLPPRCPAAAPSTHHRLDSGWVPISLADVSAQCRGAPRPVLVPKVRLTRSGATETRATPRYSLRLASNTSHRQNAQPHVVKTDKADGLQLVRCPSDPSLVLCEGGRERSSTESVHMSSGSAASPTCSCATVDHCEDRAWLRGPLQPHGSSRRIRQLLTMCRTTRSGKIYGYG